MKSQDGARVEARAAVHRLHGAAIHLLRSLRTEDQRSGVSGPKLSVLSVLVFGGPASLSELAEAEQVRRPTMTQLVNTLEMEGMVRKRPGGGDRRRVRVEATAKGRRLLEAGRNRRLSELAGRFEALSARDRAALLRALDAFERLARPRKAPPGV
ncbi:MAG: MarR family winged helix-turn-helix transcriptional regulator [Alphaproteobacteria bacterium]